MRAASLSAGAMPTELTSAYGRRSLPTLGGAANHPERPGRPPEAVHHELDDLLAVSDPVRHDAAGLGDRGEVDPVGDEAPRHRCVVHDDRVLAATTGDVADGVDGGRRSCGRADDLG